MPLHAFETFGEAPRVGDRKRSGYHTVTEAEIVAFAERWDPQPFHLDMAEGRKSSFGELVASGLHTLALTNSLSFDARPAAARRVAGKGINALRWLKPLRPNDRIRTELEILSIAPASRRDVQDVVVEMRCVRDDGMALMQCELSIRTEGSTHTERASEVVVTKDVARPANVPWSLLADFRQLDRWLPVEVPREDQPPSIGIGTDRVFRMDKATFRERLVRYDRDARFLAYRLIDGPLPVRGYRVWCWCLPTGAEESRVVWQARFYPDGVETLKCERLIARALTSGLDSLCSAAEAKP